jgi:hypothetical protein
MSDRLPLTEVSGEEILARVVYQIILADYHIAPENYDVPVLRLLELAHEYHQHDMDIIAADIRLVAIWCGNGGTVATWLRARIVITTGRASRLAQAGRARRR